MNRLQELTQRFAPSRPPESGAQKKFGAFEGVFLPTLLTILGAVMYLRTGWVVGNAGLLGAWAIIILANAITLATGLSISTVVTNVRVGAGGSFSLISQSLGLEAGGSVNVPFYLAQAISVGFYIFAFSESWLSIFPNHSQALILFIAFAACSLVAFVSVGFATRIRYPILFIVSFSLFSIFLGSFPRFGDPGAVHTPQMIGAFADGNFWQVFAVFFPAVTGLLAGVNLSGTLATPRRSIPKGALGAILVSFTVYMALAYWASRVATPDELLTNFTVMVDKAAWGWAVQAGMLAATFSAALNSMVGAPRILQAMAAHAIVPFSGALAHETETGEPRPAMAVTAAIGIATLLFGLSTEDGINSIAPLMTMFFLITYAVLNAMVLIEQIMGLTSFRPLLRIPRYVPLIGLAGSLVAMFLIAPLFSIISLGTVIALYQILQRRQLKAPWSDVRSGMFTSLAEWAAKHTLSIPQGQERAWKPSLLMPVQSTAALRRSYRFISAITRPNGSVHIVGGYAPGEREQLSGLPAYEQVFDNEGIFARIALLETEHFLHSLQTVMEIYHSAFFRPNILFLSVNPARGNEEELQMLADRAEKNQVGMLLYLDNPRTALGREKVINVWIREQSPAWQVGLRLSNLDLTLLLAYQLARNWQGRINLITVIDDPDEEENGREFFRQLIDYGRMPRDTQAHIFLGTLEEYLPNAPQADLNIFGVQEAINFEFMQQMVDATGSTCIFVRDSGLESALA